MPRKKRVTVKKVSTTNIKPRNVCRAWAIIGGIIMFLLGIALYARVLSLEGTVAILLIIGGLISIIGCGKK